MPKQLAFPRIIRKIHVYSLVVFCVFISTSLFLANSHNYNPWFQTLFQVNAQEIDGVLPGETLIQDKERPTKVTATVPDPLPPTSPVLISPEDESLLATNLPTFVWYASSDSQGINKYQFYIDGELLFDNLPTSTTNTDTYTLVYDGEEDSYSLNFFDRLIDGTHTWKVVAYDTQGKSAESVTWSFTIDSLIPFFIISDIGAQSVTITSQDLSTIPTEPVILYENSPLFQGTGEPLANVSVAVTYLGKKVISDALTIDELGEWLLQIGILPRDEVIYFTFTITDEVGHIAILENVPIIIKTGTITISIPLPPPLPSIPPVEIPTLDAQEVRTVVFRNIIEQTPLSLQEPVRAFLEPEITQKYKIENYDFTWLWPLLVPLIVVAIQIARILKKLENGFSFKNILKALKLIGFIPGRTVRSIMHSSRHQAGVPYQKIVISGKDVSKRPIYDSILTDEKGFFESLKIDEGVLEMSASSDEFQYPTLVKRPPYIRWYNWYQGETFRIDKETKEPSLSIPVEYPKEVEPKVHLVDRILFPFYSKRMLGIIGISLLVSLNVMHFASLLLVLGGILYQRYYKQKQSVVLIHNKNNRLKNAIIKVFEKDEFLGIAQTNDRGLAWLPPLSEKNIYRFEILYRGLSTNPEKLLDWVELKPQAKEFSIELHELV